MLGKVGAEVGDVSMEGLPILEEMTKESLDVELEKGYQSVLSGNVKPAEEVFESLRQEFDL